MNITSLKRVLPILLKNDIVPFLWGTQGIGKTQSVRQYSEERGLGFVHLHLATQADVGDIVGLLHHKPDGTVGHSRPEWWPTGGEGVVFLDELNRAHPDIIQAMFSFITSKAIHTHKLPPGWRIVAAGNYATEGFQVTDTSDRAWMSRFCHLHIKPTVEELTLFLDKRGYSTIADFLSEHRSSAGYDTSTENSSSVTVTPDPRAWADSIGPLELETNLTEEDRFEIYSGIVGTAAAAALSAFKKKGERRLRLSSILSNYESVRPTVRSFAQDNSARLDLLSQPINELEVLIRTTPDNVTETDMEAFKAYMLDIPLELAVTAFKKLNKLSFAAKGVMFNDEDFAKRLVKGK